jgi:D-glycero-D-manno-heptose 1,7-bisphosphate phosphatase
MKLIILDRDGVINEDSDDFIKTPEEWVPIDGSAQAIAQLHQAGFTVVVATNQSGVGRGYFSIDTLTAIHQKMIQHVETTGGKISGIFYCPHAPDDGCDCRKPKAGLIDQIITRFKTDVVNAPLVGDSLRDLECGVARGCCPVLVKTGKGRRTLEKGLPSALANIAVYDSLLDFTQDFLAQERA